MGRNVAAKKKAAAAPAAAKKKPTTSGPTKKIAKKSASTKSQNQRIKSTIKQQTADSSASSPSEEEAKINSTTSPSTSSATSPSPSITTATSTSTSPSPAPAPAPAPAVRKPSAKLAARRAKVLSYEAQLAPGQGPKPVKGVQKGAAPTKSEGELKRVEQLAAHLRTLQEDEEARERLRQQEEEAARRLDLTSVSHRRGADKTAFDVWDAHPEKMAKQMLLERRQVEEEWVDLTIPKPVKPPKGLLERQHPTNVPAVEVAAPGNSYRPTYDDHQDVLGEVLAKRLKRKEEKRKLNRTVRPIQQGLKRKRNSYHEYTAGLEDILGIKKPKQEADDDDDAVSVARRRPIASSRWSIKTSKTERNKLKKRENRRKTKKYKKLLKKRRAELEAIPAIAEEIAEEETEQAAYLERKRAEKADQEGKTRQLSRHAFARQPMPYLLSNELPKTLRQMAPLADYNPLKERFISLQKRNLIEARVRVAANRRYRVKAYVPKSAKRDWAFIHSTSSTTKPSQ